MMVTRGTKRFHEAQAEWSRRMAKTVSGGAAMWRDEMMLKEPKAPWVGVGRGVEDSVAWVLRGIGGWLEVKTGSAMAVVVMVVDVYWMEADDVVLKSAIN